MFKQDDSKRINAYARLAPVNGAFREPDFGFMHRLHTPEVADVCPRPRDSAGAKLNARQIFRVELTGTAALSSSIEKV
jgi:hypothetical protein